MDINNVFIGRSVNRNANSCRAENMNEGFNRFRKIAFFVLTGLLVVFAAFTSPRTVKSKYISLDKRSLSPVNSTFYIDPVNGDDDNNGTDINSPWRSFDNINALILTKGNTVKILSPGDLISSLYLVAEGTEQEPVTIEFVKGVYNFFPDKAVKKKFNISNTNDAPDSFKSIAFYYNNSKNVNIIGNGAEFIFRGKVMETVIDSSENISIENLSFDYKRPTVSELKIIDVAYGYAVAEIHKDSKYKIEKRKLLWLGEGWEYSVDNLWQEFNPETDEVKRHHFSLGRVGFVELSPGVIKMNYYQNPGFKKGVIYQIRESYRDYAAVFTRKSKNINWNNVNVYFMHGMGFVNQCSENITFNSLRVAPKQGSGRTCSAWADILHFSGCKGQIKINNCFLSAANDDAINIHGTHLKLDEIVSDKKIIVSFMHMQTFGFNAFNSGDTIEFIDQRTLLPVLQNVVTASKMIDEFYMELTLKNSLKHRFKHFIVVDNISCTPRVLIKGTTIKHIPTRGVLLTTRRNVVVENNEFYKTHMSAILIADDANSWYESGYVTDVNILNNRFINCGSPVINIHPENLVIKKGEYVHSNIKIENNYFKLLRIPALSAKSTENITFTKNRIETSGNRKISDLVKLKSCSNVKTDMNSINTTEK